MDYSTLAQNLAQDTDGVVFDVQSLYAHWQRVKDWRARRGRRCDLAVILVALVLAKNGGGSYPEWDGGLGARAASAVQRCPATTPTGGRSNGRCGWKTWCGRLRPISRPGQKSGAQCA